MKEEFFTLSPKLKGIDEQIQKEISPYFQQVEAIKEYNQLKVLKAFGDQKVRESDFYGTTGYGYGDRGRDTLDKVFAQIVGSEDALVRHNFTSGTHALTVALFGILRPGDTLISITGEPYDTMSSVIGLTDKGENKGSLKDFGITYKQVELIDDEKPNFIEIEKVAKIGKVLYIQRSRGYSLRASLSIDTIEEMVKTAKKSNPNVIIFVDNCYGEFVEKKEPTQVGADLIVGSLIKNPGGGIARTGGYIAGRKDLVSLCAYRLTTPGTGKEVGCTLEENRPMFMGLFQAPNVTGEAVKVSIYASALFSALGYRVTPRPQEVRRDIITSITLETEEKLIAFCRGIQGGSPVDSFVTPEPWAMPGYEDDVIMAAGGFIMGSSIELSADGPIKPPYIVWMQGGLTYYSGKMGVLLGAESVIQGKKGK